MELIQNHHITTLILWSWFKITTPLHRFYEADSKSPHYYTDFMKLIQNHQPHCYTDFMKLIQNHYTVTLNSWSWFKITILLHWFHGAGFLAITLLNSEKIHCVNPLKNKNKSYSFSFLINSLTFCTEIRIRVPLGNSNVIYMRLVESRKHGTL